MNQESCWNTAIEDGVSLFGWIKHFVDVPDSGEEEDEEEEEKEEEEMEEEDNDVPTARKNTR